MKAQQLVQDLQLSSYNPLSLKNKNFRPETFTQIITKNLFFVMIAAGSFLSVGCDNQVKGGYGSASDGSSLSPCTNDAVTTGPCKIETAGVAVTDDIADLLPANIVNGITIFGVLGTATGPYAACTDDALNAGQCSTATNRYVTATNGANVSGANGSLTASIPTGFYSGKQCEMSDTNLVAGNIKDGVTIFGVLGTYVGTGTFMSAMASTMHRDKTETQITLYDETVTDAGTSYPNDPTGYRAVPDIGVDDDGYTGGSVTYVDRTGWSTTTCGTAQATINDRIADCASVFGANATWDGAVNGNAGQGVWKLVSRTGDITGNKGREVWRDERTGLLWSSLVATSLNWCKASGSNNITNNPTAQDDPSDYCDNANYQNTGTGPATKAVSACFEDGDNFFTTTDGSIDNAGKAGLGLSSTPVVGWRLPNIYDFQVANTNGIRFVMPDMGAGGLPEWSASVGSGYRGEAWVFSSAYGSVDASSRYVVRRVRCVGR